MSTSIDGGPAFPMPETAFIAQQRGMSLRDLFAAVMLHAMFSRPDMTVDIDGEWVGQKRAGVAYAMADAMLAERTKVRP